MSRPRDGVKTKFYKVVMPELQALVPDFSSEEEADRWYMKMIGSAWFKRRVGPDKYKERRLFDGIKFTYRPFWCTDQASRQFQNNQPDIGLSVDHPNPMQALHILAHVLQPADTAWHGGEFSQTFLDLIERAFTVEIRRQARKILLDNKIKTRTVKLSEEERLARSNALKDRKNAPVIAEMMKMIRTPNADK